MKNKGLIQSVYKSFKIINLLAQKQKEMTLGDISKELRIPKPTVHGLLSTMRQTGFIEQSISNGKYWLGVRFFELGSLVAKKWDVRNISLPFIEELVEEVKETVQLAVLDNGEVLYIEKRECSQSLRIVSDVGRRLPAHCTAVGKILLGFLPLYEVEKIIETKGLVPYTKRTITDTELFKMELAKVRSQGFALDNEEIMEGLRCVAAPIVNHEGKVVAAISTSGPLVRLDGEPLTRAIQKVVETARGISNKLGNGLNWSKEEG